MQVDGGTTGQISDKAGLIANGTGLSGWGGVTCSLYLSRYHSVYCYPRTFHQLDIGMFHSCVVGSASGRRHSPDPDQFQLIRAAGSEAKPNQSTD